MPHYVNKLEDGSFQLIRKNTTAVYIRRTPSCGGPLNEARVFPSKTAATNSLRQAGLSGEPVQVVLKLTT